MSDTPTPPRSNLSRTPADAKDRWLSLGPASRLLGVDPHTLRRWADEGRVEVYVTPGGHRRFDRRAMERIAATTRRERRPLASLGASPERVARAYRRRYTADDAARRVATSDGDDRERYREDGRRLVAALIAHLDADHADAAGRNRAEREAKSLVEDLAGRLHRGGLSLTEAAAMFVAARRPFLAELAGLGRRRALDAARLGALYEDASALLDRLLVRLIETYQEATDRP